MTLAATSAVPMVAAATKAFFTVDSPPMTAAQNGPAQNFTERPHRPTLRASVEREMRDRFLFIFMGMLQ